MRPFDNERSLRILTILQDILGAELPDQKHREQLATAIQTTQDPTQVLSQFITWCLQDPESGISHYVRENQECLAMLKQTALLYEQGCTDEEKWTAAIREANTAACAIFDALDHTRGDVLDAVLGYAYFTAQVCAEIALNPERAANLIYCIGKVAYSSALCCTPIADDAETAQHIYLWHCIDKLRGLLQPAA